MIAFGVLGMVLGKARRTFHSARHCASRRHSPNVFVSIGVSRAEFQADITRRELGLLQEFDSKMETQWL